MAWQFNGTNQYLQAAIGALSATGAGPATVAICVNLDATTDGAFFHLLTSGNASCAFLECFATYNYGTGAAARNGPAGATGSWRIIIVSKQAGASSVEWTEIIIGGATTHGTASGGTLGDGSTPGATGKIQVGRFQTSATELIFAKVAAEAHFNVYMASAARAALTTWAAWLATSGVDWAMEFTALTTRVDATGGGGDETARFGDAFTLVADPAGFFPGGSDVTINDTSGGSLAGSSTGAVAAGVVLTDTSGATGSGSSGQTVQQGVVVTDTSGATAAGRSTESVAQGVVLADASGGTMAGSSGQAVLQGVVVQDGSGATIAGRSPDTEGAATVIPGASGGAVAGSSRESLVVGVLIQDGSGGSGAGGSGSTIVAGFVLADASGGTIGGRSPDLVFAPVDVTIQDTSGATVGGRSVDTADTSEVVHDAMVMPVLLNALVCLQDELAKVETPPLIYTVRPGAEMEPSADPWMVECCAGIGWVRMASNYESGIADFPEPTTRPASDGCPPETWAVVIELGVYRCMPVAADPRGGVVTPAQWLAATQQQMDDQAAMRRALCCLRDLYGAAAVAASQINPLPISGNCGGSSMQVTIQRDACDC